MQLNGSLQNGSFWDKLSGDDNGSESNDSYYDYTWEEDEDVFGPAHVKYPLIAAYSIVFLCCFFGNLIVMVVVMVHRRMRTATNFFLANLALADFCVGVFCVYQNLLQYLTYGWSVGDFLCRMYHFVHGLSYTASILILTTISLERYVVIVHPMWGRRFITLRRLRITLVVLWLVSAVYNSPRLILYSTLDLTDPFTGEAYTICINQRNIYDAKQFDVYNFGFLFVFPLLIMGFLYTSIGFKLWRSERMHGKKRARCCGCLRPRKRRTFLRVAVEANSAQGSLVSSLKTLPAFAATSDSADAPAEVLPSPAGSGRKWSFRRSGTVRGSKHLSVNVEVDHTSEEEEAGSEVPTEGKESVPPTTGSIVRQSSIRSGSTRRLPNGSIKFAGFDSENRVLQPLLTSVLMGNHRSSLKVREEEKDAEVALLADRVDCRTETQERESPGIEKRPVVRSVSQRVASDRVDCQTETLERDFPGISEKLPVIRSVSQRGADVASVAGASLRSCASDVSAYETSASQRSQTDDAVQRPGKKIRRKGSKVLRSRRKIIRLLIAILVTFAACNLPFHARKFWQNWSPNYDGSSSDSVFLTIATTLVLYLNSGINPFLYAFLSANFRKSVRDVVTCKRHLWSAHVFSPNASNNSRVTTTSSAGPVSQGSMSSAVSNF